MTLSHGHRDVEWNKIDILRAASRVEARPFTIVTSTKFKIEHNHKLESDIKRVTLKEARRDK